jgi:threonine/homoserine/homoserine lactone efflux protein
MFSLATIFVTSFMLALSGAMMPGPLLSATISESTRRGVMTGPILILGHALLEFTLLLALLIGLAPLLKHEAVFIGIALLGAGILAWTAVGMIRSLPIASIHWDMQQNSHGSLVFTGILMSLSNPYWTIWWATIGLGYLMSCKLLGMGGVAAFFLGHVAGDLAWYALISFLVFKGRHLLTDRIYRGLIAGCALFLVCFACFFAYAGINKIIG